jgi:hypothetical protein
MKRTLTTACVLTALLLITLALVVAASAEAVVMHTMPPAQFDVPYTGKLTVWTYASSKDLRAVQSNAAEGNSDKGLKNAHWGGWAFASLPKKEQPPYSRCSIHIVDAKVLKAAGRDYASTLRHEIAHCVGWPQDHPGSITTRVGTAAKIPTLPEGTTWAPGFPPLKCLTPALVVEDCAARRP